MECTVCREALSARMDGEREPVPAARADEHLQRCPECCSWYAAAAESARRLRVRDTAGVPDLTAQIMAAAEVAPAPRRWNGVRAGWPRLLLGLLGIAQCGIAFGQLAGDGGGMHGMGGHLFNESTAWNLALGIGLAYCAVRTYATSGVLPVLAGFVLVLSVFVATDLHSGAVSLARVATHGVLVAGLAVLLVVHRRRAPAAPPGDDARLPVPDLVPPGARTGRRRGHLRAMQDPAA